VTDQVNPDQVKPDTGMAGWFQSAPGRYVRDWEQAQIDAMVADVFGYYAWQIGLAEMDLLRANRIPFQGYVDVQSPAAALCGRWQSCVIADPAALPFESQSVDLLVLPHVLESSETPHQVLREVERVLVPEGRVVISGFNPWSLWGLRGALPGFDPWLPHPVSAQVSVARLKDWFKLLSLEIDRGRFGCYAPACRSQAWLRRWQCMEKAGDRWWAVFGAVYVVGAVKRVAGMRLIGPAWKNKNRQRARAAATVAVPSVALPKQEPWWTRACL